MSHLTHPGDGTDGVDSARSELDIHAWIAHLAANERLAERVIQALWADPRVCGKRVEIAVQNGMVEIRGEMASDSAQAAARSRIRTVTGVRDINDLTQVRPSPKAGADCRRGEQ